MIDDSLLTSPWFHPPVTHTHTEDKFATTTFYAIAHWLIVLTFLLTSATLFLLRSRRSRRLTNPPQQAASPC